MCPMNLERLLQLRENSVECAGLDPRWGGVRVAVHWVALPHNDVAGALYGLDVARKVLGDLACAVAGDQCDFADFLVGVYSVEQVDELRGCHRGADLDTNGVRETTEELDVGTGNLPRAVADPEEVCRGVVVAGWWR